MKKKKVLVAFTFATLFSLVSTTSVLAATDTGSISGASYNFNSNYTYASSSLNAGAKFNGGTSVELTTLWCNPNNVADTMTSYDYDYDATMGNYSYSSCSAATTAPDSTHKRSIASDSDHGATINGAGYTNSLYNN